MSATPGLSGLAEGEWKNTWLEQQVTFSPAPPVMHPSDEHCVWVGKSLPVHRTLPDHVHCVDLKEPADVMSLMHLFDRFIAGVRIEP